ncbi:MAG: glucose-6-phosphate isomerase [Planctomycetes bacterium]|nr:glucose-6-phosphate isomerase [Planctomycetota bacterium]
MNERELWQRYREHLCVRPDLGMWLDISRMRFADDYLSSMSAAMAAALEAMRRLEAGEKANIDEGRMVGHYWLRAPELAPSEELRTQIRRGIEEVKAFARDVHTGQIRPQRGEGFYAVIVVGIGGSALGPQLVADALGGADDVMVVRFVDNTDPDGMDRVLTELEEALDGTLTVVVSKSGGTLETRNGMMELAAAYRHAGLNFAQHAVAVTQEGSILHQKATHEGWLRMLPMWDFVGGRTSVTSAVGLLPAALQGVDVEEFLAGARACDAATREREVARNPAALLALMWHYAGAGRGRRNMVVLPYRDRLALFSRYLQQLVMESLGKARDRAGREVHQGLTVYGNKGTTDQHAFVQQLQEGPDDFFATFIQVLHDRDGESVSVEDDVTSGDYLTSFLYGTRDALYRAGRDSITLTLERLNAQSLGALIALYERAVGLYAELINVNAYHQPGVEVGKHAAREAIALQRAAFAALRALGGGAATAEQIAAAMGRPEAVEAVFHVLEHAAQNPEHGVQRLPADSPCDVQFRIP